MFGVLLLLFTVVPVVELWLLIRLGSVIGGWETIGIVIATGVLGAALARHEGLRTLRGIQTELGAGRLPADRMIDALLILVAGVVLVTPGILTDGVGFLLLIPPIRAVIRRQLKRSFRSKFTMVNVTGMDPTPDDDLIDVEARSPEDE